jgi:hypothetical protein
MKILIWDILMWKKRPDEIHNLCCAKLEGIYILKTDWVLDDFLNRSDDRKIIRKASQYGSVIF